MADIPVSYVAYIEKRAATLLEEHRRWGESLFKLLVALNTGGIAISLGVMNAVKSSTADLTYLKVSITFFLIGAILALLALRHEFTAAKRLIENWNARVRVYYEALPEDRESKWNELIESDARLCLHDSWDLAIGYAPGICSVIGILVGILTVWCW
jgi:hypothetical protein